MEFQHFTTTSDDEGRRLDRVIKRMLPSSSLSALYRLIRKGLIRVDASRCNPDTVVHVGNDITIAVIDETLSDLRRTASDFQDPTMPQTGDDTSPCPFPVLFENSDLLFINKPSGVPVHGDGGLDRLIGQAESASRSLSFRSGPLHRLDKETSGVIAFSRSLHGAQWFSEGMQTHAFNKLYLGIVEGRLDEPERWEDRDEYGRPMITRILPISEGSGSLRNISLILYRIETGRKHQIRIQSSLRGHPLMGDARYGSKKGGPYYLHAGCLKFPEDRLEGLPPEITAPLPERFISLLRKDFPENVLALVQSKAVYCSENEELQ